MNATHATQRTTRRRRELAHRRADGVDVRLWWRPADDSVAVTVLREAGSSFELVVDPAEALDAFEHPYAYAALRGLDLAA